MSWDKLLLYQQLFIDTGNFFTRQSEDCYNNSLAGMKGKYAKIGARDTPVAKLAKKT